MGGESKVAVQQEKNLSINNFKGDCKQRIIMVPRIEILAEKKLIGKRIKMTFSNNKTFDLWQSFMPI